MVDVGAQAYDPVEGEDEEDGGEEGDHQLRYCQAEEVSVTCHVYIQYKP